ncbi:hypothetical protein UPYG_G00117880 [Umbra pygmaea]|uniref:Uncharacterized protein n=1 Tax=Umbra pygmaea TaxID=75934 RepID=A0ABD0X4C3_UMBPY
MNTYAVVSIHLEFPQTNFTSNDLRAQNAVPIVDSGRFQLLFSHAQALFVNSRITLAWENYNLRLIKMDHTPNCEDDNPETMNEISDSDHSGTSQDPEFQHHNASTNTSLGPPIGGRVRLYSESHVCSQVGRRGHTEFQDAMTMTPMEESGGDGAPFRGRSQSAPPALWAAKKYGRQLRRMSDEFDIWLDKGEPKRGVTPGKAKQVYQGWFSFLWSPKEAEGRD